MRLETILQDVKSVGLAGHIRPDGDSVGACVGLWNYLKDNYPQIQADIWLEQPDRKFSILEGYEMIRQPDGEERKYDLFISLDAADRNRLGAALPYFENAARTLCVDHHISNKGFGDEKVIDAGASSACEVLFRLLDPEKISRNTAAALYMGIAHDTGVFQYSCTSPETMRAAAALMEKGIPYSRILEETYYKKTYLQNQVLGRALLESMRLLGGRCIVSVTRKKDMDFFGVQPTDLEGIVSQLRLTEGVEVAIYLYEIGNHEFKVSLRSKELVDVSEIASYFGGGGHVRAAGVTMQGTFHDIVNNLTPHIERQLAEQETA